FLYLVQAQPHAAFPELRVILLRYSASFRVNLQPGGCIEVLQFSRPESPGLGIILFLQPLYIVAVRTRRSQFRLCSIPVALINLKQLSQQNLTTPRIEQDMMIAPHEIKAFIGNTNQRQSHHGWTGEIKSTLLILP